MDRSYVELNRAQRQRLQELTGLSDDDLGRPLGEHWTVAVALAHLAYWDGRVLATIEAWQRHGLPLALHTDAEVCVNDARLPLWRATPPQEALAQAIQAAELVDALVESLTPDEAAAVAAQRYWALARGAHREGHLDEIAAALSGHDRRPVSGEPTNVE